MEAFYNQLHPPKKTKDFGGSAGVRSTDLGTQVEATTTTPSPQPINIVTNLFSKQGLYIITLWLLVRQEALDLGWCRQETNSYPALTLTLDLANVTLPNPRRID